MQPVSSSSVPLNDFEMQSALLSFAPIDDFKMQHSFIVVICHRGIGGKHCRNNAPNL
jgi:hypothetical protein